MTGSIGKLAEQVVAEVKAGVLTKLAEHTILEQAETQASANTDLGKAMLKLAIALRSKPLDGVSVSDLKAFVEGLR